MLWLKLSASQNWNNNMITNSHFILYVQDQSKSAEFYSKLLNQKPTLNVPGMTEFRLSDNSVLGLMPSTGIKKLLGDKIKTLDSSCSSLKAELYLIVNDIENYLKRAESANVKILSELKERDWNHNVVYFSDPDHYIIAIAEILNK